MRMTLTQPVLPNPHHATRRARISTIGHASKLRKLAGPQPRSKARPRAREEHAKKAPGNGLSRPSDRVGTREQLDRTSVRLMGCPVPRDDALAGEEDTIGQEHAEIRIAGARRRRSQSISVAHSPFTGPQ